MSLTPEQISELSDLMYTTERDIVLETVFGTSRRQDILAMGGAMEARIEEAFRNVEPVFRYGDMLKHHGEQSEVLGVYLGHTDYETVLLMTDTHVYQAPLREVTHTNRRVFWNIYKNKDTRGMFEGISFIGYGNRKDTPEAMLHYLVWDAYVLCRDLNKNGYVCRYDEDVNTFSCICESGCSALRLRQDVARFGGRVTEWGRTIGDGTREFVFQAKQFNGVWTTLA